jgi:glutathione peroxidase
MKFIALAVISLFALQTSIYTISFTKIDGTSQSLSAYQGKKILIVNIATGSNKIGQMAGLKQLQQQFGDSLVIIAFPSNSFGNESRTNIQIQQHLDSLYHPNFILTQQANLKGTGVHPLFNWLASESENGVGNVQIVGDFEKYLIDQTGNIAGVFAGSVEPLDQKIVNAIAAP